MKVTFELRKEKINLNGLIPIQIVVRAESVIVRKNVGLSTKLEYWTGSRLKPSLKRENENNYQIINNELQLIEAKVNDIFFFFKANKISFSRNLFLEKYDDKDLKTNNELDFFTCFDEYIKTGQLSKSYNTIKSYVTVKGFLFAFQNATNYKISFQSVNSIFFEELMKYAFQTKEIENNYYSKIIGILKSFLNWCVDKDYTTNREFEKFKASENDIDIIYLTNEELFKLYNFDFKNDRLNHTKDFYCMGCFTGLRFSDLSKLYQANISDTHITISIQKTKTQNHSIPLNKYSKEILKKYKNTIYEPLPYISAQKFNKYIKECCQIIGLDKPITITSFSGTKKILKTLPKYELITSHTARKTFITNSLILGIEPKAIKKIANIKKDAVLDKYMEITEEYKDLQMDKWNR